MDSNSKKLLYKSGSILLGFVNVFFILKCAFFSFSESISLIFGLGSNSVLGDVVSDSLQNVLENASNGKLTVLNLQKVFSALAEVSSLSGANTYLGVFSKIFYWVTILLVVSLLVESVGHIFDQNWDYCSEGLYVIFIFVVIPSFIMLYKCFKNATGSGNVSITPFAIASLILPFVSDYFWRKYLELKDNLEDGLTDTASHKLNKSLFIAKLHPSTKPEGEVNDTEILSIEKQIEGKEREQYTLFYTLGQKYYYKKDVEGISINNNKIFSLYEKIQQLEEENVGINNRIDELKNIIVCPSCRTENTRDSLFCYHCGTKLKLDNNSEK